MAYSLFNR